ncbi:MAG: glutamate--tRNA ligase [Chloroflexota bacterium]
MSQQVRTRFAPSPTGFLHVGNIRTALFSWLWARHNGGVFILRIEDTDRDRIVPGALESIFESLRWLGLHWDEGPEVGGPYGPYFQSQRLDLYRKVAEELIARGAAYRCYCTPERLEALRAEQRARGEPPGYDRRCRFLSPAERAELERQGLPSVVRFKMPLDGTTVVPDLLRGEVVFENAKFDDHVLLKSDGYPTYHLAVVVDDHYMRISHVIRGDEWIPSAPRHVLLYRALDWEMPVWVHTPTVLGKDRSRLSKRHGALPVLDYREQGYLPEAVVNYLALLGWSAEDENEVFSPDELIRAFDLMRIGTNPAIFDPEKLLWLNGVHIRRLAPEELAERLLPFLERDLSPEVPRPVDRDLVRRLVPLIQERIKLLTEAAPLVEPFFVEELSYDPALLIPKGLDRETTRRGLKAVLSRVAALPDFEAPTLEAALRELAEELGVKAGTLFMVVRVAVTGRTVTPPLFESMAILGRDRVLRRLDKALNLLG